MDNREVSKQKNKDDISDGSEYISFNSSSSIKSILKSQKGEFDQSMFDELLTRKDISHLFLSDIHSMMAILEREFPDIIKTFSIGKTWQEREMMMISLDARALMESKGIHPSEHNKTFDSEMLAHKVVKDEDGDALTDIEIVDDHERKIRDEKAKKQNAFEAVPDSTKLDIMSSSLGLEMVQLRDNWFDDKDFVQIKTKDAFDDLNGDSEWAPSISELAQQHKGSSGEKKPEEKVEEKKVEEKPEEKKVEEKKPEEKKPEEKKVEEKKPEEKKVEDKKPEEKKVEEKKVNETKPEEKKVNETKPEEKKADDKKVEASDFDITKEKSSLAQSAKKDSKASDSKPSGEGGNAIMITGATHARELLSMQVPLFLCLKFLHQAVIQDNHKYQQILRDQKFYFLPTVNIDGAAVVEEHWLSEHKILNKRKNMNPNLNMCDAENSGVDLNRNYGVDWVAENISNHTELCGDYWPGTEAFSEPETRAIRDFVGKQKDEIKFIINCHTSGNDFIWPFNGRDPNDIETRAPGYLAIFQDIAEHAPFPEGVMKGNSYEVIGDKMGGDADDYMLATYGIPSVTSEMGFYGQFIKDWRCQSKSVCYEILSQNVRWMEYVFNHVNDIAEHVFPK